MYGFTIIDNKGVKYTFGSSPSTIEFSRPGYERDGAGGDYDIGTVIIPMTWHLREIESPQQYKITFHYKQHSSVTHSCFSYYNACDLNGDGDLNAIAPPADSSIKSTFINGCNLDSIVSPSGKVIFDTSIATEQLDYPYKTICATNYNLFGVYPDICLANVSKNSDPAYSTDTDKEKIRSRFLPKKVDMLRICNNNNEVKKQISLHYTNNRDTRLKLLAVKFWDRQKIDNSYEFNYNPLPLPAYHKEQSDWYGFYNGDSTLTWNMYNISNSMKNFDYIKNAKIPNPNFTQAELLTSICYPTGGKTELTYEQNDYSENIDSIGGQEGITGGVRIKKVINSDHDGRTLSTKIYHYKKNFMQGGVTSSGKLIYMPKFSECYRVRINRGSIMIRFFYIISQRIQFIH